MTTSEPVQILTDDGLALSGDLTIPPDPWASVVLLHPHPMHGGDRHSFVTGILNGALPAAGLATVRFDFRGVGESEGHHGNGVEERLDVEAASILMAEEVPGRPVVLVGWSFGADVALSVTLPTVAGWVAVAPPLDVVPLTAMGAAKDDRPKLLLVPEHDQYRPPHKALGAIHGWHATALEVLWGADHACMGRTDRIAEAVVAFCRSQA